MAAVVTLPLACAVEGCGRLRWDSDRCGQHRRFRTCDVEGCAGKHQARGLCDTHYQRLRKRGSLDDPPTRSEIGTLSWEAKRRQLRRDLAKAAAIADARLWVEHTWSAALLQLENRP